MPTMAIMREVIMCAHNGHLGCSHMTVHAVCDQMYVDVYRGAVNVIMFLDPNMSLSVAQHTANQHNATEESSTSKCHAMPCHAVPCRAVRYHLKM